jgi:hypothetical protein
LEVPGTLTSNGQRFKRSARMNFPSIFPRRASEDRLKCFASPRSVLSGGGPTSLLGSVSSSDDDPYPWGPQPEAFFQLRFLRIE